MSNRMHRYFACLISAGLSFAGYSVARAADKITLSGGPGVQVIEGQVIRDTPDDPLIVINTGGKLLMLNRIDIGSIVLDAEGRAEYARRRDKLKDNQATGHFELYKWAASHHLYDYADRELGATLKADSSHAEARKIAFDAATLSKPTPAQKNQPAAFVGDAPVIGLRPVSRVARMQNDYDEKIFAYCKTLLATSAADDSARKAATRALVNERTKATEALFGYLDPAREVDEQTRLTALVGLDILKPTGVEVSKRLAQSALTDPYPSIRTQTVALIKSRNDEYAINSMVDAYIGSFTDSGQVRDPIMKAAAAEALKNLNDKRVYSAMFYRATMEIRTATSDLNGLTTRQIDSYTVNSGAQANVLVPLSFPIQFPELKLTSIKTTVCAPCAALIDYTGQNLGNDLDAWAKFIRMQK